MPGSTPTYAYPYPLNTDAPDGPAQIQALADRMEVQTTRLDDAIDDSGLLTNMGITAATGFSVSDKAHRIIGKMLFGRVQFTRTGGTLSFGTAGELADTPLGTIDSSALWPQFFVICQCKWSVCGSTVQLSPNTGVFTMTDGAGSSTILAASNGQLSFAYPIA